MVGAKNSFLEACIECSPIDVHWILMRLYFLPKTHWILWRWNHVAFFLFDWARYKSDVNPTQHVKKVGINYRNFVVVNDMIVFWIFSKYNNTDGATRC